MRAAILAVGDELVSGLTTDTNSGFLAQSLRSVGVEISGFFTVADDEDAIVRALRRALEDAVLVVTTGGLGPTADDLTTACVARLAGVPLELDAGSLAAIEERFRARGLVMPENNRKQALFPRDSQILPNPSGTAPGFICAIGSSDDRHVACLPGVPREMHGMVDESLLPWVASRTGNLQFDSRVFSVFGLTESRLDELLAGAVDPGRARLSFRAAFPRIQARVTVAGATPEEVRESLDDIESVVRARLGDNIYAMGDIGLEETVGSLLRERSLTLGIAESCTGGLIGHRITEVPGSSDYFLLGVVAYSNQTKQDLLGVRPETLTGHGAVSEATVAEMAEGVRLRAAASIGLATSGVAGPGGGTAEKPVGTVCIALAWEDGGRSWTHALGSRGRSWIKEMTAQLALNHLRHHLFDLERGRLPGDYRS